ncbi:hypothetical protein [Chryseobacterium terrae]|uniref:Transmembrane family 220, helix n=1 Tax=Chryseobacterium terrae TaxID=3163299 RepID=A0ABW8XZ54_9FLAO
MKNLQLLGLILVIVGSFLPLVHVPIIGNWNYWQLDHYLAGFCWIFCAGALFGIVNSRAKLVNIFAVFLLILFVFTLFAIKYQASSYFSFLPFKSWTKALAGTVKLQWGWFAEFLGALIMLFVKSKKEN